MIVTGRAMEGADGRDHCLAERTARWFLLRFFRILRTFSRIALLKRMDMSPIVGSCKTNLLGGTHVHEYSLPCLGDCWL